MAFSLGLSILAPIVVGEAQMEKLIFFWPEKPKGSQDTDYWREWGYPGRERGREEIPNLYPQYLQLTPETRMRETDSKQLR